MNKILETLIYVFGTDKMITKYISGYDKEQYEYEQDLKKAEKAHKKAIEARNLHYLGYKTIKGSK